MVSQPGRCRGHVARDDGGVGPATGALAGPDAEVEEHVGAEADGPGRAERVTHADCRGDQGERESGHVWLEVSTRLVTLIVQTDA